MNPVRALIVGTVAALADAAGCDLYALGRSAGLRQARKAIERLERTPENRLVDE